MVMYILLVLICFSCKNESVKSDQVKEFEQLEYSKEKWQLKENNEYVYRDRMYPYILYDKEVRSLPKDQLLALLGEADKVEANHYYYTINRQSLGLMTLHTKTLVIKFTDYGSIEWIKIHK